MIRSLNFKLKRGLAFTNHTSLKAKRVIIDNGRYKKLELYGTTLAAIGFLLLTFGFYLVGFILGLLSCFCLIPVFNHSGLNRTMYLQIFFLCANITGIINNI